MYLLLLYKQLQLFSRCIINLLLKPLGESKVKVYNPANGHTYSVKFVIAPKNSGLIAILGSKASQFMNILTLNINNLEPELQLKLSIVIDDYHDVFKDELGQSTDLVSNLVVTMKKSGGCLDPQELNKALKREHFQLPTLDDILPNLSNAKRFSTVLIYVLRIGTSY